MNKTAEQFKAPIPAAVRRQARKAEREHKKAYSGGEPPVEAPETAAAPNVVAMATETPPEPPVEAPAPEVQAQTPPEAPETPPEPVEPAPVVEAQAPAEDWEQKYRTLQGMMEKAGRDQRMLQQEISGLQATIAAMTDASPSQAPSAQGSPSAPAQRRLKDEDVEAYGQDMIDVIRAAAHDEFGPALSRLQAENAELTKQLGGVVDTASKSEALTTEALLDREVPKWRDINMDPEFLSWLGEPDVFSGVPRQQLLNDAGSGPRVVQFFKAYLNENQAIRGRQEAPAAPSQQPQTTQHQPTVDKTSLVAPGRPTQSSGTGAGAAADSEEPKFFTQKDITAFYRDVQKGKYKHDPATKTRKEKEIHAAAMSGRVRA